MAKMLREISAGGIVVRQRGGRRDVLLVKDPYGRWTWPKGKLEPRETLREAALREVREETGLRGLLIMDDAGRVDYIYRRDGRPIDKTVHFFLMEAPGYMPLEIQRSELLDGRWFSVDAALKKVGYRGAKTFLRKTLRLYEKGVLR